MSKVRTILDKTLITGSITVETGLHIGFSKDFSPIGAVDSIVIRDPATRRPIIPGSSIKGKMRYLLARSSANSSFIIELKNEDIRMKRLFGSTSHEEKSSTEDSGESRTKDDKGTIIPARLQFFDLFMDDANANDLEKKTDLYLTEIKFENTISRLTSVANPRQIERVPKGAKFDFRLVYNIESDGTDEGSSSKDRTTCGCTGKEHCEVRQDFEMIAKGLKLLQIDYLGGHGTRGYGRISFSNLAMRMMNINDVPESFLRCKEEIAKTIKGAENFASLSV